MGSRQSSQSAEDRWLLKGIFHGPSPESSPASGFPGFSAASTGPNCEGQVRH